MGADDRRRFWSQVEKSPDCWEWAGTRSNAGYGVFRVGRPFRAHRVAWLLASGEDPGDRFVLHRCDNPPCVRKAHLFLGDPAANSADMVAKGRTPSQRRTHCKRGHPIEAPGRCPACHALRARQDYSRRRAEGRPKAKERRCDECGSVRFHAGRGLCHACYQRDLRRRRVAVPSESAVSSEQAVQGKSAEVAERAAYQETHRACRASHAGRADRSR